VISYGDISNISGKGNRVYILCTNDENTNFFRETRKLRYEKSENLSQNLTASSSSGSTVKYVSIGVDDNTLLLIRNFKIEHTLRTRKKGKKQNMLGTRRYKEDLNI
jgi:hypothetical protein